jgi:hypothetical protein
MDMSQVAPPDPDELSFTLGEFYQARAEEDAPPVEELDGAIDDDLRDIFRAGGIGRDAATLLWDNRQAIMRSVSGYGGSRMYVVKAIIDRLTGRLRALKLRLEPGSEIEAVVAVTALISTLTGNFVSSGHLLPEAATDEVAAAS